MFNPQPKKGTPEKKPKKPLKRSPIKRKYKPTGEADVFAEIAEEREWVCFVTGQPLRELTPTQFMHVLPKALNKYPEYKLYKPNIQLVINEVHYNWDHTDRKAIRADKRYDKLFKLEKELKENYPNV